MTGCNRMSKRTRKGIHPGIGKLQRLMDSHKRLTDVESHLQRLEQEARGEYPVTEEQQLNLKTAYHDLLEESRQLSRERYELWAIIHQVPSDCERTFLEYRYYFGLGMKDVIEAMHYSEPQVYRIRKMAVKSFCKIFDKY